MRRKKIPFHIGELNDAGMSVKPLSIDQPRTNLLNAHRDDHYIFMLQQEGDTHLMLDFNSIKLKNTYLYFIKPGQVHHYLRLKCVGWFLAVSPSIIEKDFRNYLEELSSQFFFIKDTRKLVTILKLLNKTSYLSGLNNFETKEIQFYVNAFIAIVCSSFDSIEEMNVKPPSRSNQITIEFKQLLKTNFRTFKKPADYAKLLNISPAYLNETLTKSTGFSTSYWIQQELFLEAKSLLYHTELTVKEIAFELGFEDYTYFSRLFKKINGLTPTDFKKIYHDLSN